MNNKQKFEQVVSQVEQIKKRYQEEDLKCSTLKNLMEKTLVLKGLEFKKEKCIFNFNSTAYGIFDTQMICNRRKRIRAVPICFFVTLYERELQTVFPKEDIQIPYTLKGFWEMKQAVKFVEDLIHLQNDCQNILLWQLRVMNKEQKEKVNAYREILNEFAMLRILSGAWEHKISYETETENLTFKVKKENMKLDAVPLCKLLTLYYARVFEKITAYEEKYATKAEEEKLRNVKNSFLDFVEKNFAQRMF